MLGALIHCWVHLAGVSGGEKTYIGSGIIIKIYPALSLAIGGRDGMDGSRGHWMTRSNYRTRHQSWLPQVLPCCWAHLAGVSGGIKLRLKSIIIIKIYPGLYAAIGGRDGMDCSRRLWMTCSINRTRHQSVLGDRLRRWGHWVVFFINIHIYICSYSISMYILPFPVPQKRRELVDGGSFG